jgi:hypothetical protein
MSSELHEDASRLVAWAEKYAGVPWNMLPLSVTVDKEMSPMQALKIGVYCAQEILKESGA